MTGFKRKWLLYKIRFWIPALLLCMALCIRVQAAEGSGEFEKPSNKDYSMKVSENECFELMANGDGTIAVLDKRSGRLYESNPRGEDPVAAGVNLTNLQSQLYVTYADTMGNVITKNSVTDCVNKGGLTYQKSADGGIRFLYDFQAAGFGIPVEYHLNDKGLVARILVGEITEAEENASFYLTDIAFLPFFGAAGAEQEGYIFVPDGSGALIYLNNDKASYGAYSQPVYGRDTALVIEELSAGSETARIPVFGMQADGSGFVAVISEGDTNATLNALTSGVVNSYNNVYAAFRYRPFTRTTFLQGNTYASNGQGGDSVVSLTVSPVTPEVEAYTVEYLLMENEDLDYVDMAAAYRDYLIDRYGMSADGNIKNAPFYLNLLGGLKKEEYVLGVKTNLLTPLTTYAQAGTIMEELGNAGIDSLVVKYTGWQKGGMESVIPTKVLFEKKLGGKSGFQKLETYADQNGIGLFMDFDFVNLYKGGGGISEFSDAAQTVGSTPAYQYTYNLNTLAKNSKERWKVLAPSRLTDAVDSMLGQREKLRGAQLSLSTLGGNIYSDFTHKEDGLDRSDAKGIWEKVFASCGEMFENVMTDDGNAYVFPYVSHIYNAPSGSSGYDIEDETVPFYQIVLHGLVSYSVEPLNLCADPEGMALKAVETGSSLSACLMYADNESLMDTRYNYIFSGNYEAWVDTLGGYYERTAAFLNMVSAAQITGHEKLQEDVYRTEFSDGTTVYVNYRDKAVTEDGVEIPARDFVYRKGGAR